MFGARLLVLQRCLAAFGGIRHGLPAVAGEADMCKGG